MSGTAFILDGYVDEPACLGVPPYISPYIRTVAGALLSHHYTVRYLTIDQLRKDPLRTADLNGAVAARHDRGGHRAGEVPWRDTGHPHRDPAGRAHGPGAEETGRRPDRVRVRGEGGQKAIRQVISGFDALLAGEPAVALDNYLNGNEPGGSAGLHPHRPVEHYRQQRDQPAPVLPVRDVRARDRPGLLPRGNRRLLVLHRAVLRDAEVPGHRGRGCRSCCTPCQRGPALPGRPAAGHPCLRCRSRGIPGTGTGEDRCPLLCHPHRSP